MDELNQGHRFNWKTVSLLVGSLLLVAAVKVVTGPPPPGKSSWREAFSRSSRRGVDGRLERARIRQTNLQKLVSDLDHPDTAVRWKAIVELEELGPKAKGGVKDIIPFLGNDDWRIRYYAAEILGMIGPDATAAIAALQDMLNDSNEMAREKASWAITEITGRGAP